MICVTACDIVVTACEVLHLKTIDCLIRGIRYSAIPVMSLDGIHDLYLAEGNVNGEKFETFVRSCLLPVLQPFNWTNPHSVVIMDNASIHHVEAISEIIEDQAAARLLFLPPYSPDLNPIEEVFSKIIMKKMTSFFKIAPFQGHY